MNWYEVKLVTLQKLFSADTTEIIIDDTTMPYLSAMPGAANACLNYIASTVRHITKSITIEPTTSGAKQYHLKELASDFYSLDTVYFGDNLLKTYDYRFIGTDTLLTDSNGEKITVIYKAYPEKITADTADDYELPLYPEVCELLPCFMASQLYKDDDMSTATVYWNEFSALLEDIKNNFLEPCGSTDGFVDTKGWWS